METEARSRVDTFMTSVTRGHVTRDILLQELWQNVCLILAINLWLFSHSQRGMHPYDLWGMRARDRAEADPVTFGFLLSDCYLLM